MDKPQRDIHYKIARDVEAKKEEGWPVPDRIGIAEGNTLGVPPGEYELHLGMWTRVPDAPVIPRSRLHRRVENPSSDQVEVLKRALRAARPEDEDGDGPLTRTKILAMLSVLDRIDTTYDVETRRMLARSINNALRPHLREVLELALTSTRSSGQS